MAMSGWASPSNRSTLPIFAAKVIFPARRATFALAQNGHTTLRTEESEITCTPGSDVKPENSEGLSVVIDNLKL